MNPRRPVLRVALLALTAALLGFAVIAAVLGWRAHRYVSAYERATTVVEGTIVEDGIGDVGDIRVRWMDHAGREHVQRFGIYDTDRYTKGRTFPVAYDPAEPGSRGFPADPDETSEADDLVVPILIAGFVTVLVVLAWMLRGLLFRRAAGQPRRLMMASVLAGDRPDGPPISVGNSTWVALAEDSRRGPDRWQRVMWHPAVDSVSGAVPVTVHGDVSSKRRVVIELPGQVRLVPIGRLRHRPPKRVVLEERSDVGGNLHDFVILPAGASLPENRRWWGRAVIFALVGTALGGLWAILFAGGLAVPLAAAAGAVLLVNVWALTGAEP
ncbi:DUF3592 domain-containing protein [Micromonospora eburnea]|uniref:DUF3592 domain-containing protein n=1 Tax=Micromonospora eburnea TaxID=227316 RepID=A0A1C6UV83_9ACTN|nr:DUF3592 domain-containing protein [Micromonospora eburnea]SCL57773.1 hypothetical protein GA0070604_3692 [Micromonospora eburnea]